MALQHFLIAVVEDEFGDLGREEALEPAGALDLGQLVGDALLQRSVPLGELGRLGTRPCRAAPSRAASISRARPATSDRPASSDIRRPRPRGQPRRPCASALAVTRMIGMKGRLASALSRLVSLDPVELRHHHVEQDQVRAACLRATAIASSPSAACNSS